MTTISEEARAILREIVEGLARRQTASIDMLGHCLKLVPELDVKRRIAAELDLHMQLFGRVRDIYSDLGWNDLQAVVREGVEDVRFPETRLEFGAAYFLTGLAEEAAMRSHVECAHEAYAAIARAYVEASPTRPIPSRFLAFAAEQGNRPRAQEILDHWYRVALDTFRMREGADQRAQELGLRSSTTAELVADFRERLAPFVAESGLVLPSS